MKTENLERYLDSFGRGVVSRAKSNLSSAGKGGGNLEKSLSYEVMPDYSVRFYMANYGTFVDKGVKGAGGEIKSGKNKGTWSGRRYYTTWEGKRKDSPFKYGSGKGKKNGIYKGIGSFIKKKGLQPRSAGGQYMSPMGLKMAIVKTIWVKGIHGISFFQKALGVGMEDYAEQVLDSVAKDITESINIENKQK